MTSKITLEAHEHCAAHTMVDQLKQLRLIHAVETAALAVRQRHDMQEVELALKADEAWGGYHARLTLPIEGAD